MKIFVQIETPIEKKAFEEVLSQSNLELTSEKEQGDIVVGYPIFHAEEEPRLLSLSAFFKPFHFQEILSAINRVKRTHILSIGEYTLNVRERKLINKLSGHQISLTEKEAQIIQYLSMQNREVSREELLKAVWAYHEDVETHTLETHIYRLRQKIEKDFAAPRLIFNNERGYFLNEKTSEIGKTSNHQKAVDQDFH